MTSAAASSNAPESADATDPSPLSGDASRRWLLILIGLLLLWVAGLVTLILVSANPFQFSEAQLRQAEVVVTAQQTGDRDGTEFRITAVWTDVPELEGQVITLPDLDPVTLPPGEAFIIPLSNGRSGGWVVTQPQLPTPRGESPELGARIVYPATSETEALLKTTLERVRR